MVQKQSSESPSSQLKSPHPHHGDNKYQVDLDRQHHMDKTLTAHVSHNYAAETAVKCQEIVQTKRILFIQ